MLRRNVNQQCPRYFNLLLLVNLRLIQRILRTFRVRMPLISRQLRQQRNERFFNYQDNRQDANSVTPSAETRREWRTHRFRCSNYALASDGDTVEKKFEFETSFTANLCDIYLRMQRLAYFALNTLITRIKHKYICICRHTSVCRRIL